MPSIHIIAIRPASDRVIDAEGQLRRAHNMLGQAGFAGGMIRRMAKYPPQMPAYGARVSLGNLNRATGAAPRPRKGARVGPKEYVRTGTLGRGWQMGRFGILGDDLVVEVVNLVDYGVHVQGDPDGPPGERQTDVMADKGWQDIVTESEAEFAIWRPRLMRVFSEP